MSGTVYIPRGTNFVRTVIARAVGMRDSISPTEVAAQRWGPKVAEITKAAVSVTGNALVDYDSAQREFFAAVNETSILGRLSGLRRVPVAVRTITQTAGTSAQWVKRGSAAPAVRMSLSDATLPPLKVMAVCALTKEVLRDSTPEAEGIIRADLARAVAEALDTAFIDPNNAGVTDEMPASVTNGVTPVDGTGTARADLKPWWQTSKAI